jgi:hypothetical protein
MPNAFDVCHIVLAEGPVYGVSNDDRIIRPESYENTGGRDFGEGQVVLLAGNHVDWKV